MSRETRTFKQTKGTGRAEYATKFNTKINRGTVFESKINRQGGWGKVLNIFSKNKETK